MGASKYELPSDSTGTVPITPRASDCAATPIRGEPTSGVVFGNNSMIRNSLMVSFTGILATFSLRAASCFASASRLGALLSPPRCLSNASVRRKTTSAGSRSLFIISDSGRRVCLATLSNHFLLEISFFSESYSRCCSTPGLSSDRTRLAILQSRGSERVEQCKLSVDSTCNSVPHSGP